MKIKAYFAVRQISNVGHYRTYLYLDDNGNYIYYNKYGTFLITPKNIITIVAITDIIHNQNNYL